MATPCIWRPVGGEVVTFEQRPLMTKNYNDGHSERISMMRSAVLTQSTRVTDGRTDEISVAYTRYSIYAVARKKTCRQKRLAHVHVSVLHVVEEYFA